MNNEEFEYLKFQLESRLEGESREYLPVIRNIISPNWSPITIREFDEGINVINKIVNLKLNGNDKQTVVRCFENPDETPIMEEVEVEDEFISGLLNLRMKLGDEKTVFKSKVESKWDIMEGLLQDLSPNGEYANHIQCIDYLRGLTVDDNERRDIYNPEHCEVAVEMINALLEDLKEISNMGASKKIVDNLIEMLNSLKLPISIRASNVQVVENSSDADEPEM